MKKILLIILVLLVCSFVFSWGTWAASCVGPSAGDSEATLQDKINECTKLLQISSAATKPHEQQLAEMQKDIDAIEANIAQLTKQIEAKKVSIAKDEGKLNERQKVLDSHVRDFYKKDWQSGLEYMLVTMFSSDNVGEALSQLAYRQNLIDREKKNITSLVLEISELAEAKKSLEETQTWLAGKKASLEVTLAPIRKLVNEAKAYQKQLSATVGSLSARQQELISAKIGSLGLSRSAGISMACADDRKIDPGFSPGFAFYTFGIPHRVGMSQFGAYGRAKDGQKYDQILRAYYNFDGYQDFDVNIKVDDNQVNIHWSGSLDDYVKRIYEVPGDWPPETLKAQAIAARSYALAYTDKGSGSICATQNCQVFKTDPKGGAWEQAVNDTSKKAMVRGGNPIKAWFSSTDGGYTWGSGDVWCNKELYAGACGSEPWTKRTRDTTGDIGNISDLFSKAYDRDSQCFYNAQGWRNEYKKSAWLRSEEVADIVNVVLLSATNNMVDTWDAQRVKNELGSRAFNRIDNVSMDFDLSSGKTTKIHLTGDAGSVEFSGNTFKDYFNLRAPANIAIVGPLYNIEKR